MSRPQEPACPADNGQVGTQMSVTGTAVTAPSFPRFDSTGFSYVFFISLSQCALHQHMSRPKEPACLADDGQTGTQMRVTGTAVTAPSFPRFENAGFSYAFFTTVTPATGSEPR
jgi:hypothetical protein